MAKVKSGKAPKYAPPSRLTHQAGVEMPKALINFLIAYNYFVGKMTEEFRAILNDEEESIVKDVLQLILMLDSKMGYYPVSVLIGMKDRESVPKSYFARVDAVRSKTVVGKAIATLSKHVIEEGRLPHDLQGLKRLCLESMKKDIRKRDREKREIFMKRQRLKQQKAGRHGVSKFKMKVPRPRPVFDSEALRDLRRFLPHNEQFVLFERFAKLIPRAKQDPLVQMLLNYDKVGKQRLDILPACLTAWAGLDSSFLELVIVGSLQTISSNRELMELWLKEEEVRKAELTKFEVSDDGAAMLKYCERFENGAWHYFNSISEVEACRNWKGETELVAPNGRRTWGSLNAANPVIKAFFFAKKTWCDLNRGKKPPTWKPVTPDQNPHFPFFDGKFVGVDDHFTTSLKLPEIADEILAKLRQGEFPAKLGKKKTVPLDLTLEERLRDAEFVEGNFLRKDRLSSRVISETFKGIRFARDKKSQYWKALITTEPTFQFEAKFQDAISAYWNGERPQLPAGTIFSSFVVSISPTHHPDGEIGYMTFWGVDDHGASIFLGATKVSPYQVFQGQDVNRMVWDPKLNDGAGGFRKGKAMGASASVEVNDLLETKRRINASRKAMGFPERKLPEGENAYWWKKLSDAADTLRKQTAANVIAIQAVIEESGATRDAGPMKFKRPKGVEEFRKLYPDGGYVLLVPAPMGASHQRHKDHENNRVLQIVGVAQIYELILSRAFPSGVSTMRVSKSGQFQRCARPWKKLVEITMPDPKKTKKAIGIGLYQFLGPGTSCDGLILETESPECTCGVCGVKWPRGIVGSVNIVQEFFNPKPKASTKKKTK